jgi:lipase chaperone LimK
MSDDLERQLALDRLEFDALQAERDELSRRLADLERERAVWQEHFDHMAMQIAEARNAALEEAAVYLENMDHYHARDFAHYIRFIKDKQP